MRDAASSFQIRRHAKKESESYGIVIELANEVMDERCDGVDLKVRV